MLPISNGIVNCMINLVGLPEVKLCIIFFSSHKFFLIFLCEIYIYLFYLQEQKSLTVYRG